MITNFKKKLEGKTERANLKHVKTISTNKRNIHLSLISKKKLKEKKRIITHFKKKTEGEN
jgi:hypothetical protein